MPSAVATSGLRSAKLSGDLFAGVSLHVCAPLLTVCLASTNDQSYSGVFPTVLATGSLDGSTIATVHPTFMALSPFRCAYFEPRADTPITGSHNWDTGVFFPDERVSSQICSAFAKYRCKKMTLHYRPKTTLTQAGYFAIAVSADPSNPLTGVTDKAGRVGQIWSTIPNLETAATCVSGAYWLPYSIEYSFPTAKWLSLYETMTYGSNAQVTFASAPARETFFCSLAMVGNYVNTGAMSVDIIVGQMWWECDFEFCDPTPVLAAMTTVLTSQPVPLLSSGGPLVCDDDDDPIDDGVVKIVARAESKTPVKVPSKK